MVDTLSQEIDKFDGPGNKEDHKRLAEHLLSTIELFDMLPPTTYLDIDDRFTKNEWEPEDE